MPGISTGYGADWCWCWSEEEEEEEGEEREEVALVSCPPSPGISDIQEEIWAEATGRYHPTPSPLSPTSTIYRPESPLPVCPIGGCCRGQRASRGRRGNPYNRPIRFISEGSGPGREVMATKLLIPGGTGLMGPMLIHHPRPVVVHAGGLVELLGGEMGWGPGTGYP